MCVMPVCPPRRAQWQWQRSQVDGMGQVVSCSEHRWRSLTSSLYHVVLSGEEGVHIRGPVKYPFLQFVDTHEGFLLEYSEPIFQMLYFDNELDWFRITKI